MENPGAKKRKYRLNIKKFSIFLSVLIGIMTLIVLVTGDKDSIAANSGTNITVPDRAPLPGTGGYAKRPTHRFGRRAWGVRSRYRWCFRHSGGYVESADNAAA